jgi:hypothetical protein
MDANTIKLVLWNLVLCLLQSSQLQILAQQYAKYCLYSTDTPPLWDIFTLETSTAEYEVYRMATNFISVQWTLSQRYPNTPDDTLNDVVTYQYHNSSDTTLYYMYGVDFPTVTDNITQHDEYDWKPTGPLAFAFNTYKVIAWGYDEDGVPYAALYETKSLGQTEESFDIISRSDKGPSNSTLAMISRAVDDLGIASLTKLKNEAMTAPLVQDGERVGQMYPLCNSTCMANGIISPDGMLKYPAD